MNLSPVLARLLSSHGHDVVHWSEVGDYRATDVTILAWASEQGRVLVTHDPLTSSRFGTSPQASFDPE